jgi:malate/lactate dehydrogenase
MNQKRIVPVSCYQEALGVCLSMPVVLGQSGIEKVLDIPLNAAERLALSNSAEVLRKASYDHRDL